MNGLPSVVIRSTLEECLAKRSIFVLELGKHTMGALGWYLFILYVIKNFCKKYEFEYDWTSSCCNTVYTQRVPNQT